jgi:tetratricopeptide (TPR) repeat protein
MYNWVGVSLEKLDRDDEAIMNYRRALELEPDNAIAYTNFGRACDRMGRQHEAIAAYHKAIACYRKALELDPRKRQAHNDLAWLLVPARTQCSSTPLRPRLAKKSVELEPQNGSYWNTLGIAHYRAGAWKAAIDALKKSDELLKGDLFSFNAFFLAMAHWQLGAKDEARKSYEQAVQWMEKNKPEDEELHRFRAEAAELLGITPPPPTADKQPVVDQAPNTNDPAPSSALNPKP